MCLAIPVEVIDLPEPGRARVRRDGLEFEVDLSLISEVKPGDYLIVHAGFAIEVLDLQEAEERLELFRRIAEEQGDAPARGAREGGAPPEGR